MSSFIRNLHRPAMELIGEWTEEFSCFMCGNTAHSAGFYPCNAEGDYVEPYGPWVGLYRCDGCGQRYHPRKEPSDDDANESK